MQDLTLPMAGFLHNPCPCFDIVFAQLGVIPRTRKKFVEIVAVTECNLITNQVRNKESKKQPFQICFPLKKEKNYLHLIYNIFILSKIAGNHFHEDKLKMNL